MPNAIDPTIVALVETALRCPCGSDMKPSKTEHFDVGALTGVPFGTPRIECEATWAACLRCDSCQKEIISEETREELLDVLTLSIAHAWRRLYPEDVAYLRLRLKMGKTEFERAIGVPEEKLSVKDYPDIKDECFYFPIEEHHVFISDAISDAIKRLAASSVTTKRAELLLGKWDPSTITSGKHQLTTKNWYESSSEKIKNAVSRAVKSLEEFRSHTENWIQFWTEWCVETAWVEAELIEAIGEKGVLIGKFDSVDPDGVVLNQHSLFILTDGGYAFVPVFANDKMRLSSDEVINEIMRYTGSRMGKRLKKVWHKPNTYKE